MPEDKELFPSKTKQGARKRGTKPNIQNEARKRQPVPPRRVKFAFGKSRVRESLKRDTDTSLTRWLGIRALGPTTGVFEIIGNEVINEEKKLEGEIKASLRTVERSRKRAARHQVTIDKLKAQTRQLIAELKAA